jgi:hypothetical protein
LSPPAGVAVHSRPRGWTSKAIRLIEADAHRSADTHLLRYPLPSSWSDNAGIELYLKVTLLADSGDRYADTYFSDEWVKAQELDTSAPAAALTEFERSGHWD